MSRYVPMFFCSKMHLQDIAVDGGDTEGDTSFDASLAVGETSVDSSLSTSIIDSNTIEEPKADTKTSLAHVVFISTITLLNVDIVHELPTFIQQAGNNAPRSSFDNGNLGQNAIGAKSSNDVIKACSNNAFILENLID